MVRLFPALFFAAACAGAVPAEQTSPRTAPAASSAAAREPAPEPRPRDAEWGRLRVVSRALELELPELSAWRYRAGKSWVRLTHAASDSVLELWVARAERTVRPADCEARGRLARADLWRPSPELVIDRRVLDFPPGFRTELTLGLGAESRPGEVVTGHVIAFGAAVGRCLGVHFTTRASGEGADAEIARRLALMADRAIPSLVLRSVDDRVPAPASVD